MFESLEQRAFSLWTPGQHADGWHGELWDVCFLLEPSHIDRPCLHVIRQGNLSICAKVNESTTTKPDQERHHRSWKSPAKGTRHWRRNSMSSAKGWKALASWNSSELPVDLRGPWRFPPQPSDPLTHFLETPTASKKWPTKKWDHKFTAKIQVVEAWRVVVPHSPSLHLCPQDTSGQWAGHPPLPASLLLPVVTQSRRLACPRWPPWEQSGGMIDGGRSAQSWHCSSSNFCPGKRIGTVVYWSIALDGLTWYMSMRYFLR